MAMGLFATNPQQDNHRSEFQDDNPQWVADHDYPIRVWLVAAFFARAMCHSANVIAARSLMLKRSSFSATIRRSVLIFSSVVSGSGQSPIGLVSLGFAGFWLQVLQQQLHCLFQSRAVVDHEPATIERAQLPLSVLARDFAVANLRCELLHGERLLALAVEVSEPPRAFFFRFGELHGNYPFLVLLAYSLHAEIKSRHARHMRCQDVIVRGKFRSPHVCTALTSLSFAGNGA